MFSHIHLLAWHVQPLHITIHLHRHQISLWKICINCWVSKKPFWPNVSSETGHLLQVSQLESQVQPVCTSLDMIACQCLTFQETYPCFAYANCNSYNTKQLHTTSFVVLYIYQLLCLPLILPLFLFAVPFFCSISSSILINIHLSMFSTSHIHVLNIIGPQHFLCLVVHFFLVRKRSLLPKVPIFETKKMALRVAKSKF